MYPDSESVVLDWLEATYPDELARVDGQPRADIMTPANLQALLAAEGVFVRVQHVTGRDDGGGWNPAGTTNRSVVDIETFALSRATAYAFSQGIRSRFTGSPHRVGLVVIDRVGTEEEPRRLPWDDDNIWRFGATYRISARR